MLSIVDVEATRPSAGVIHIRCDIISFLPPLFLYAMAIGYDGEWVYRELRLSKPPIKGMDHFDKYLTDSPSMAKTAQVWVTSVGGLIKDQANMTVIPVA